MPTIPKGFRETNFISSSKRPAASRKLKAGSVATTLYIKTQNRDSFSSQTLELGTGFLKGEGYKLPFTSHLVELRKAIKQVLLFFLIAFILSYIFSEKIYGILLKPFVEISSSGTIIYTNLTEAFVTYIELSFFAALLLTLPVLCFQILSFSILALAKNERRFAYFLASMMPLLFISGVLIAYFYAFPAAWRFFLSFESSNYAGLGISLKLYPKIEEYLALSIQIMLAFGIAFQLPVMLVLLTKLNLLSIKTLKAHRRIVIVMIFIIAAIITPPDALSQIILGSFMIFLYEASIILCSLLANTNNAKI